MPSTVLLAYIDTGAASLVAIGAAVAIGAVVAIVVSLSRRSSAMGSFALVRSAPDAWIQRISVELAALPKHQVTVLSPLAVQVTKQGAGPLRIVLAVVLFPIGLLFLIGGAMNGTLSVVADEVGSRVQVSGKFSRRATHLLETHQGWEASAEAERQRRAAQQGSAS